VTTISSQACNEALLQFLQQSPSPFHAVESMRSRLEAAGFEALDEADSWQLRSGGAYYVCRSASSIIAFRVAEGSPAECGVAMVGAHTDSPCLKIKPEPVMLNRGMLQLGVEVYGGALLAPWFDRDLGIAGRVDYADADGNLRSALVDTRRAVAVVPSLAIHLDREANQNRSINAQRELPPLLALVDEKQGFDFAQWLLDLVRDGSERSAQRLLGHELVCYDTQAPAVIGLQDQFISSARLDNLLSCHIGTQALIDAKDGGFSLLVCNDHEEVGSASACGAQGPFLESVLTRLLAATATENREQWERMIRRSLFLSVDNAHGIHPNFADRHDNNHGPLLNRGPVIKINANQRYASNSRSVALFRALCERAQVPVQSFVMRSDMACGSTIGPITASGIGVETVDVGVPTFAMHSVRELAGSEDPAHLLKALTAFYRAPLPT